MKIPKINGRNKIRDCKIIQLWLESDLTNKQIAARFKMTERRVSKIVENNKEFLLPDVKYEKAKRIKWIRTQLRMSQPSRRDPLELHEQLRKELEGDKPVVQQNYNTIVYERVDAKSEDPISSSAVSERDRGVSDQI